MADENNKDSSGSLVGNTPPGNAGNASPPSGDGKGAVDPWYKDWLSTDGSINTNSYERLPDELKSYKDFIGRYKNATEVLRGLVHHHSMASKKGLVPVEENAPPEVQAEFDKRLRDILRVPEKPEGYGFARPEDVPEHLWNDGYAKEAAAILHKHGVRPAAAKELFELNKKSALEGQAQFAQADAKYREEQTKLLQSEWVRNGGDPNKLKETVERGCQILGIEPKDLENSAALHMAVTRAANLVAEDKSVKGDGPQSELSGPEAEKQAIMFDERHPLFKAFRDDSNPLHDHAVKKIHELNGIILRRQNR